VLLRVLEALELQESCKAMKLDIARAAFRRVACGSVAELLRRAATDAGAAGVGSASLHELVEAYLSCPDEQEFLARLLEAEEKARQVEKASEAAESTEIENTGHGGISASVRLLVPTPAARITLMIP
jgi:hypothetical protein